MPQRSYISDITLTPSASKIKISDPLTLDLQFKVDGRIREVLDQETWTVAYNRHDTVFGIRYDIKVQTGSVKKRDVIEPVEFVRKASFYWSRNPKLPPPPPNKKIWAMIVIDDRPKLPDSVEHAKSLIFDVKHSFELMGSSLRKGKHKLLTHVSASWSKHTFTEPVKIDATSNEVEIICD